MPMWIIMAWQYISPEVSVKDFKKCCISNEDDMLCKGREEDGNIGSEGEEDDDTDCAVGATDTGW
jgi:hypothetical protein